MLTALAEALVSSTGQLLDGSARLVLEHARVWEIVQSNPASLQFFTRALDDQDGGAGNVDFPMSPDRRLPHTFDARRRNPQFKESGKRRGSRSPKKAARKTSARKRSSNKGCGPDCDHPNGPNGRDDREDPPSYTPLFPSK